MRLVAALVVCAGCGRIGFDPLDDEAYVQCQPLAPALTALANVAVQEPAIHLDGLRMYAAQVGGTTVQEASRSTPDTTFGPFAPTASFLPYVGDQTFIEIAGAIVAFAHPPDTIRQLVYCANPFTSAACSRITMTDAATGLPITDDHDGPALAYRDGALVMAFNRDRALYTARPTSADFLAWSATMHVLPESTFTVDDPELTADGQLLLLVRVDVRATYALRWDARSARYVDPIVILDPAINAGSPSIGVQDADSFELFVNADTRGIVEPHHTTCIRLR